MPTPQLLEIDPAKVKIFIHRERDPEAHKRAIRDTKRRGQIEPGEVRDIRHLPVDDRRTEDGKIADYGLIAGQGRLLRAKALGQKFRAFLVDRTELDSAGRFISENFNRVPLPWAQKARLIQPRLQAGESAESIADSLSLTVGHVQKFSRLLSKAAPGLEDAVAGMAVNDAEVFITLPKEHQQIVMEAFHETKESNIKALVKVARQATEKDGKLSSVALRKSLQRIDEDLAKIRGRLKLIRLHHSLSVQNLQVLLEDPKFRRALINEGVNVQKFLTITAS